MAAILFFLVATVVLRLSGFRYLGKDAHPLSFLILTQIVVLTVVGTIALGVFDHPMSYGVDQFISQGSKDEVVHLTFFSAAVLFMGFALLKIANVIKAEAYVLRREDCSILTGLTFVSAAILVIKLVSVSDIPILLAVKGDVVGAAESKVRILTNQTGVTFFGANYIFRSFTSYIYIASVFLYVFTGGSRQAKLLLVANGFLAVFNALYDVQKQTIVHLALATFWILYVRTGRFSLLLKGVGVAAALVVGMFLLTLGTDVDETLFDNAFHRVFIAQSEGMFFIREYINPSTKYLWLGFPLASVFGLEQVDPAAEVVRILFPTAGESWLNSNSYYIAHAWTIFEGWSVVLGPLFVLLNAAFILLVGRIAIKKRAAIFYPVVFWFIIKLPLANIFTEFLWMKVALDFLINLSFVYVLFVLFKGLKKIKG